ncbi:MAG: tRNA (adenosine(37)-N6)-threonylcarbamoyltransferase complex ATPase subunit type 1 TsaE [Gammaproteobacteria bacterium]|nr:tRNA (adenosine(37)-N6)-threonylcarbamoyltransferase complex ATPase subunit type 1 TsaE [Gammaproteobacteria bacterium]
MLAQSHRIDNESSMLKFGETISEKIEPGEVVYLIGELGSGKTTLVRGILTGLGYQKNVVSPTYTLVEPYKTSKYDIYHLDLYRLNTHDEIENLGLRDFLDGHAVCLIEWPDKFEKNLPNPSLTIRIRVLGQIREISLNPSP